ncbi:MAG: DNA methyltransferase, partial [Acidobacteriota bacterium]
RERKRAALEKLLQGFQEKLAAATVLDPACGSGNFLYVTLEHLKRLEGEVINALNDFDARQAAFELEGWAVDPHQLLGLEVNPRAAAIADLVLWIGYLQWHFRTRGDAKPAEPVLRKFRNIECRDAVLAYDSVEIVTGEDGQPVTRWDGRTMKTHPVTGEDVPDDAARVPLYRYINARKAEWPAADYVVGNPPFIGNWRMRSALGDGYTETLRQLYGEIPESCDYVMFWWDKAAELARRGQIKRFGLITTNSLRQTFNRRVIQKYLDGKEPLSLLFAIPDHPWVDSADGAAVRISMTVGEAGEHEGTLFKVEAETAEDRVRSSAFRRLGAAAPPLPPEGGTTNALADDSIEVELSEQRGKIFADLTIGANVAAAQPLQANAGLSCPGVKLHGAGFIVTPDEASQLGLGRIAGLEKHIRLYRNGRDLTSTPRNVMVIDLFGLTVDEVRKRFPEVYQWVYERVKPERDQNNRASYKNNWWIHGEPRGNFRPALNGLRRYIATVETSKHRFFVFLDESILPDNKLINLAFDDAYFLGVMSSRFHVGWALAAGSWLGVGNDPVYVKTACFEKFPFPVCTADQQAKIRALGEQLDAHRKRQQALHPDLTLTEMYNVLEKLRSGESLSAKEQATHERGLVSVLRQIHDELDAAVAEAYGWPATLSDEEILQRLVALNSERAREEQSGLIRWLRPEYQKPAGVQTGMLPEEADAKEIVAKTKAAKLAWPKTLAEQVRAVRSALTDEAVTAEQLAKLFVRGRADAVESLLQTLVSLGLAREVEEGKFAA